MSKKQSKKGNTQSKSITHEIDQLYDCIHHDQAQLKKVYEKITLSLQKGVSQGIVKLDRLKQKVAKEKAKPNKGRQKSKINSMSQSVILSLQKELDQLKSQKASLEDSYKKFNAQQKMLQQFEKEWNKKGITKKHKSKPKTKTEKAPDPVEGQTESVESQPIESVG